MRCFGFDRGKPRINQPLKSIYLSSLRSHLFNQVLARRVQRGDWQKAIDGDVEINGYPTGPLWGRGRLASSGLAGNLESETAQSCSPVRDALEWVGLSQERRSLVLAPIDLHCEVDHQTALRAFHASKWRFCDVRLTRVF